MSICKATASVTWRIFADGGRIRSRPTAHMRSSKSFRRRSWRRSLLRAAKRTGSRALLCGPLRAPFAGRIVIRVGRLLWRPQLFGHMPQVYADPRPGGGPAAHGIHQYVIHREKLSGFGVPNFPSFETGERGGFIG